MFLLPEDETTPAKAICTVTSPDGIEVYMPGDELPLKARLPELEPEPEQPG